jgi:hypothetical protein
VIFLLIHTLRIGNYAERGRREEENKKYKTFYKDTARATRL